MIRQGCPTTPSTERGTWFVTTNRTGCPCPVYLGELLPIPVTLEEENVQTTIDELMKMQQAAQEAAAFSRQKLQAPMMRAK